MVQLQVLCAADAIVVTPLLAGAIGAGHHQSVQDGQEDGALSGTDAVPIGTHVVQRGAAFGLAPQTLEQKRG